jgi:hypothetical protein
LELNCLDKLARQFTASANRCYKFYKCSQLFIRVHNEALTVAAMRVTSEDRSPQESTVYTQPNSNRFY